MADMAHKWTDWKIKDLEDELTKIYDRASSEMSDTYFNYFLKFNSEDQEKKALVDAGKMSRDDYIDWRKGKLFYSEHLNEMTNDLTAKLFNVNKEAAAYVNDQLPEVYAMNYNQSVKGINGQIQGYSFELVDKATVRRLATDDETLLPYKYVDEAKDVRWNTQKVNGEILQGILQGESIPDIGRRLNKVLGMNATSAIRNARTACTGAENKGRMDMMDEADKKGVHVKKKWIATHDSRTRETHAALDGKMVDRDDLFDNGLLYPGDPDGDPEEVYNCRCTLGYEVVSIDQAKLEEAGEEQQQQQQQEQEQEQEQLAAEGFTKEEAEALEWYVSGDGMWVNNYLRGRGDFGELTEDEKAKIQAIESATEKNVVKNEVLYRSVDASAVFGKMSQTEYEDLVYDLSKGNDVSGRISDVIGKEITENGFLSTTEDKDIAYSWGDYTGSEKPIALVFNVEDGVKGADLGFLDVEGDEQREVLLQKGLTYVPTKITAEKDENGDTVLVVYADLLPAGQEAAQAQEEEERKAAAIQLPDNMFKAKQSKALEDYLNKIEGRDPDVAELYGKIGDLAAQQSYGVKTHYTADKHQVEQHVLGGQVVQVDINIPKMDGYLNSNAETTIHELGHFVDLLSGGNYLESVKNQELKDAINNGNPIPESTMALFKSLKDEADKAYNGVMAYVRDKNDDYNKQISALWGKDWSAIGKLKKERDKAWNEGVRDAYAAHRAAFKGYNALTDIYDAITGGELQAQGYYGHGSKYYWYDSAKAEETFANYCALSQTNPEAFELLKKEQPEIAEACSKLVNSMLGK